MYNHRNFRIGPVSSDIAQSDNLAPDPASGEFGLTKRLIGVYCRCRCQLAVGRLWGIYLDGQARPRQARHHGLARNALQHAPVLDADVSCGLDGPMGFYRQAVLLA